jgi:hypothetical protein
MGSSDGDEPANFPLLRSILGASPEELKMAITRVTPLRGLSGPQTQQHQVRTPATTFWHLQGFDGVDYGRVVSLSASQDVDTLPMRHTYIHNERADCLIQYSTPQRPIWEMHMTMPELPSLQSSVLSKDQHRQIPVEGYKLQFESADCSTQPMIDLSPQELGYHRTQRSGTVVDLAVGFCWRIRQSTSVVKIEKLDPHETFQPKSYCILGGAAVGGMNSAVKTCGVCRQVETVNVSPVWRRVRDVTSSLVPASLPAIPVVLKQRLM